MGTIRIGCVAGMFIALQGTLIAAGVLRPRDGSLPIEVQSHRISAALVDGVARTITRQTFVSQHARALEAIYEFPIPEGAALVGLALETGGERLEGLLAERRAARRAYNSIVRRGRDPALVEQVGASLFRLSVFPVLPDQTTVVELEWIERVPLMQGEYRYVYPLAMGGSSTKTRGDLTLSLSVQSSSPIESITSPCDDVATRVVSPNSGNASLERSEASLERDLVVVTRVATLDPSLVVHTYRAPEGDTYFAAIVTPPPLRDDQLLARDITLLLDVSGSMEGRKLEQAKGAARDLLAQLRPADRVNLVLFNDVLRRFADAPVSPTAEHLSKLNAFIDSATARGSTALGDAIVDAAKASRAAGRVASVVLLTDGRPTSGVTDATEIVRFARDANERGVRLFPFGVGMDVDSILLEGVASAGGGVADVFRPDGEIESRLRAFFVRTASPAIANLSLTVDDEPIDDILPRTNPDVYLGQQGVIVGRFRREGTPTFRVRGTFEGKELLLEATVDSNSADDATTQATMSPPAPYEPVARDLYAKARLQYYEQARRLQSGLTEQAYFAALDRGAYSTRDELVNAEIALSLETGVQSPYTSFIALLPEDRARLNPRDATAIDEAIERAANRRRELAGVDSSVDVDTLGDASIITTDQPLSAAPFAGNGLADQLGYRGKYGGRGAAPPNLPVQQAAVELATTWMTRHQSASGAWSAALFSAECEGGSCDGSGESTRDIGGTALTLLSLLGGGNTVSRGPLKKQVRTGLKFLMDQQDDDFGSVGSPGSHPDFLLDHALATIALTEAYGLAKWPLLKAPAQRAVTFLVNARDPNGGWGRSADDDDPNLFLTSFAVQALLSARVFGLVVDPDSLDGVVTLFDRVTDPERGVVGDEGSSSHPPLLTAAVLLSRLMLAKEPAQDALLRKQIDFISAHPPRWSDEHGFDFFYAYFATYAMLKAGGADWDRWQADLANALVKTERTDGCAKGSWDPDVDPSMKGLGRVGASALQTLSLEAYYRYSYILPARE